MLFLMFSFNFLQSKGRNAEEEREKSNSHEENNIENTNGKQPKLHVLYYLNV